MTRPVRRLALAATDIPQHLLIQALRKLSKLEQQVIRLRFGLGGRRPMTIVQVAHALHINRAYVLKIEQRVRKRVTNLRRRTGPDAID